MSYYRDAVIPKGTDGDDIAGILTEKFNNPHDDQTRKALEVSVEAVTTAINLGAVDVNAGDIRVTVNGHALPEGVTSGTRTWAISLAQDLGG